MTTTDFSVPHEVAVGENLRRTTSLTTDGQSPEWLPSALYQEPQSVFEGRQEIANSQLEAHNVPHLQTGAP